MPTGRGLSVAAMGIGLCVAGWTFGSSALTQLGFAFVTLVLIALFVVRASKHDLRIERRITPARATAAQPVNVEIQITNRGRGSAPLLLLEDRVPPGLAGRARFAISGVEAGGHREASFSITPQRRGRYEIGPLESVVLDPFSLARLRSVATPTETVLVHPTIERLALPREFGDRQGSAVSALRQPTGPRGEDFYTLREYVEGDDLRKIHWQSTAKRQKVMIRQEETPWHTKATLVLDDRRVAHTGFDHSATFERAVDAAASLAALYHGSGYGYRLAGAHHPGLPSGRGSDHFNRCLDLLATIELHGRDAAGDQLLLARLAEIEARGAAEETLVLVSGSLEGEAAVALARCRRLYKQVAVVLFPGHRFSSTTTRARWDGERAVVEVTRVLTRAGIRTLVLGPEDRFAHAWGSLTSPAAKGGDRPSAPRPELV